MNCGMSGSLTSQKQANDKAIKVCEEFGAYDIKIKYEGHTLVDPRDFNTNSNSAEYNDDAQEDYYNNIMSKENKKSTQAVDLSLAKKECKELEFRFGSSLINRLCRTELLSRAHMPF